MARLVGVDLPRDKRMEIALTYIFGVGRTRAVEALSSTGIDLNKRAKEMREKGHPLLHAATEGARLRFRPVMMTSFAFILGLLPLVIAEGASELSRRAVSTPVFFGMIAASTIGILAIPMLYVVFQSAREGLKARLGLGRKAASAH